MSDRLTPESARRKLAAAGGARYVTMFEHGRLELEYYEPKGTDPQQPHTRDEVYFILAGSGWFVRGEERWRFQAGEVIHVSAGVPHRFEEFSEDFATWAIFSPP